MAPEENYAKAESFIRRAADEGAEIAILPEYHLSSWIPDHDKLYAIAQQTPRYLDKYCSLAKELGICIVPGTLLSVPKDEVEDRRLLNISYFIGPEGTVLGQYQKRNLWHPEKPILAPSPSPEPHKAFDTPLGRVGLLICWDLTFPEAMRALVADGAIIIIIPSCWLRADSVDAALGVNPDLSILYLDTLCIARAFENTAAVLYVNAGGAGEGDADGIPLGKDAMGREYAGVSQAALPIRGSLGRLETGQEGMSIVDIDLRIRDVAESIYKSREDMALRGWVY